MYSRNGEVNTTLDCTKTFNSSLAQRKGKRNFSRKNKLTCCFRHWFTWLVPTTKPTPGDGINWPTYQGNFSSFTV